MLKLGSKKKATVCKLARHVKSLERFQIGSRNFNASRHNKKTEIWRENNVRRGGTWYNMDLNISSCIRPSRKRPPSPQSAPTAMTIWHQHPNRSNKHWQHFCPRPQWGLSMMCPIATFAYISSMPLRKAPLMRPSLALRWLTSSKRTASRYEDALDGLSKTHTATSHWHRTVDTRGTRSDRYTSLIDHSQHCGTICRQKKSFQTHSRHSSWRKTKSIGF